jgi:hypothetical protein
MIEYVESGDEVGLVKIEVETFKILKAKGYENSPIEGISALNGNGYRFESDLEGYNIIFRLVPVHSGN